MRGERQRRHRAERRHMCASLVSQNCRASGPHGRGSRSRVSALCARRSRSPRGPGAGRTGVGTRATHRTQDTCSIIVSLSHAHHAQDHYALTLTLSHRTHMRDTARKTGREYTLVRGAGVCRHRPVDISPRPRTLSHCTQALVGHGASTYSNSQAAEMDEHHECMTAQSSRRDGQENRGARPSITAATALKGCDGAKRLRARSHHASVAAVAMSLNHTKLRLRHIARRALARVRRVCHVARGRGELALRLQVEVGS